jgi:PAS domain-containing protein
MVATAAFQACKLPSGFVHELWWLWLPLLIFAQDALTWKATLAFSVGLPLLANAPGLWIWEANSVLEFVMMLLVFSGVTYLFREVMRGREQAIDAGRCASESQNEFARIHELVDNITLGVLTVSAAGRILMANRAAHWLLGFEEGSLVNQSITTYFPIIGNLLVPISRDNCLLRSDLECRAWRRNGEVLGVHVSCSGLKGPSGPELGLVFSNAATWSLNDCGIPLEGQPGRARLSASLDLHEIRNLSFAIESLCRNLQSQPVEEGRESFRLLQDLSRGLGRLAAGELCATSGSSGNRLNFDEFAVDLRGLLARRLGENGIGLRWGVPSGLPMVWAEREGLFQVFLNLANNSMKALSQVSGLRIVSISAEERAGRLIVAFSDSGPGIQNSDELFLPVISGPDVIRIGLYTSRALLRCVGGDLRCVTENGRSCLTLELLSASTAEQISSEGMGLHG